MSISFVNNLCLIKLCHEFFEKLWSQVVVTINFHILECLG
jgi:hypothetical protein